MLKHVYYDKICEPTTSCIYNYIVYTRYIVYRVHRVLSLRVGWGGKGPDVQNSKTYQLSARIVTGFNKNQHITPALNSLDWPRIDALVARRDVTKVWRLLRTEGMPSNVRELLVPRSAVFVRETRSTDSGDLHLQRCRLSSTQKTFSYRASAAWNALPQSVRDVQTFRAFRAALRTP